MSPEIRTASMGIRWALRQLNKVRMLGYGAHQEPSVANGEGPFGRVGNLCASAALRDAGSLVGGKRALGTNTRIVPLGTLGCGAGPIAGQDAL